MMHLSCSDPEPYAFREDGPAALFCYTVTVQIEGDVHERLFFNIESMSQSEALQRIRLGVRCAGKAMDALDAAAAEFGFARIPGADDDGPLILHPPELLEAIESAERAAVMERIAKTAQTILGGKKAP
jgi:hypothetical protein